MTRGPLLTLLLLALLLLGGAEGAAGQYSIHAVRYATIPDFPVSSLVMGAPRGERMDIAVAFWVIRGEGRTILFDSGFHRAGWAERFGVTDYLRPDSAARLAGVDPAEVTDVIVSHAHWDHMGGIDLFPDATVWIQEAEYDYYTGAAWQEGGNHGGIDPEDVLELLRRNTRGKLRLIPGDDVEILPGIRVFTGARHTFSSQYVLVEGDPPVVLASDNSYLYRNLEGPAAVATFAPEDEPASRAALARMRSLAGSVERVVPGHDPLQFVRFPTQGRVARIR